MRGRVVASSLILGLAACGPETEGLSSAPILVVSTADLFEMEVRRDDASLGVWGNGDRVAVGRLTERGEQDLEQRLEFLEAFDDSACPEAWEPSVMGGVAWYFETTSNRHADPLLIVCGEEGSSEALDVSVEIYQAIILPLERCESNDAITVLECDSQ